MGQAFSSCRTDGTQPPRGHTGIDAPPVARQAAASPPPPPAPPAPPTPQPQHTQDSQIRADLTDELRIGGTLNALRRFVDHFKAHAYDSDLANPAPLRNKPSPRSQRDVSAYLALLDDAGTEYSNPFSVPARRVLSDPTMDWESFPAGTKLWQVVLDRMNGYDYLAVMRNTSGLEAQSYCASMARQGDPAFAPANVFISWASISWPR